MKEQNFDWLLQGCHPLSIVAEAYFPSDYPSSSARSMRRYIKHTPPMYTDMEVAGYNKRTTMLTPLLIGVIIRYMGMPHAARDEAQKRGLQF